LLSSEPQDSPNELQVQIKAMAANFLEVQASIRAQMDSDLEQQKLKLASMKKKMALEEDLSFKLQSSLRVSLVSFLN
jgi:hypothetical protein